MIVDLLNRVEPESEGLLREISNHIHDGMLKWIASADYGRDVEQHFVALRQVRDTGTFPPNMAWYLAEVLELTRWSEPEDADRSKGETSEFMHRARAFSCAALLRATREPWNYGNGIATDESTIRLILSLRALPVDFTPQAVKSLAWLLLNSEPEGSDGQVCAYGIGLLWFALQRTPPVDDETLISLANWIVRRTKELYSELPFEAGPLPVRMGVGNPPPSHWESLGTALFGLDLTNRPPELQELVQLIGAELAG